MFETNIFVDPKIFWTKDFLDTNFFGPNQNYFGTSTFLTKNYFGPKIANTKFFGPYIFRLNILLDKNIIDTLNCIQIVLDNGV